MAPAPPNTSNTKRAEKIWRRRIHGDAGDATVLVVIFDYYICVSGGCWSCVDYYGGQQNDEDNVSLVEFGVVWA